MPLTKDILDQQVDDLRGRMRLLQQDRRANVDLLEANKSTNSQEIRSLRDDNKELRLKITQLQKRLSNGRGEQHELATFQRETLHLRTEYDSMKVVTNKSQEEVNKLRDEATCCELEAKTSNQDSRPVRKIRGIENKLDKVMIKYNEAQSIRSTYAHIVKRLKEERLSFNNQMTALERTLKAKNRDHDELLLLSNDANHAKEMAQQELQNARHTYEEKRTRRAGEMRERQQVVRIRKQMLDKQEKRDAKKKELLGQQMDRSRCESENDLGLHPYSVVDDKEREEDQDQKLNIYEETFRKIKDAMGVGDVNNVLDKIYNQKSSAANLQMLTKQNRMHLDHLKREKDALTKKTEELKFNEDIVSISRKTIEDKEEVLVESTCNLDRAKHRFESTSGILMSAKSGIRHLQQKMVTIGHDINDNSEKKGTESDPTSILWSIGDVIVELMARIREEEMNNIHDIDAEDLPDEPLPETSFEYEIKLQGSRPFNQRIKLPSAKDNLFENDSISETFNDVIDDDEISRDRVKKKASQVIRAQNKLGKVKDIRKQNY